MCRISLLPRTWAWIVLMFLLVAGCTRTRSIEALPPRPATAIDTSSAALREAGLGRLEITLSVEGAPLPEDVLRLQMRATEIRLRQSDGAWLSFPASTGAFSITSDQTQVRSILNTQVPPAQFDSLEIQFGDLYVEFDANAGSALTSAAPPGTTQPLTIRPEVGQTTRVRLILNPGASLLQDHACRWHFLPFLRADEEAQ